VLGIGIDMDMDMDMDVYHRAVLGYLWRAVGGGQWRRIRCGA
jgi:hypothetical protein